MAKITKLATVVDDGDDWVGLYLDGKLAYQGHGYELSVAKVLELLEVPCVEVTPDFDWLLDVGYLPDNFEDVKVEAD